jgi:rRNA-processing protein FCF1
MLDLEGAHLALLRTFVRLAEQVPPSNRPLLFIPQIVLTELEHVSGHAGRANRSTSHEAAIRSPTLRGSRC